MSDHADTIRRTIPDCRCAVHRPVHEALDALLAERQQAIDERDIAHRRATEWKMISEGATRAADRAKFERQQAIDALRRARGFVATASLTVVPDPLLLEEIDALLGEQP